MVGYENFNKKDNYVIQHYSPVSKQTIPAVDILWQNEMMPTFKKN